jgi:hypothetical protein
MAEVVLAWPMSDALVAAYASPRLGLGPFIVVPVELGVEAAAVLEAAVGLAAAAVVEAAVVEAAVLAAAAVLDA